MNQKEYEMTNGDAIRFFRRLLNCYAGHDDEIAKEDGEEPCVKVEIEGVGT